MHPTQQRTTTAFCLAVAVLFAVALLGGFRARSNARQDGGSPVASPAGSPSPVGTPLPLFTPIAASEARNVVGRVTIELTDRGFIPSRFENAVNSDIEITLVNTGTRPHSFTIDELDVDVMVQPGERTTFTLESPPRLKQYIYYSNTPEDKALGMKGTMTIFM
jgi:Cupredoxin-like domain